MIKINDRYSMENDQNCLTIYESKVVKSGDNVGKEYLDAIAHFGSGRYDQVLIYLSEIGTVGLNGFDEILAYYKSLKNDINSLLRPENMKSIREFLEKAFSESVSLPSGHENGENDQVQGAKILTCLSEPLGNISRKEWQEIATRIKRRDGFECRRCKMKVSAKLTVHHIHSRENGGTDEDRNLLTLCKDCHDFIELNEIVNWEALNQVAA